MFIVIHQIETFNYQKKAVLESRFQKVGPQLITDGY